MVIRTLVRTSTLAFIALAIAAPAASAASPLPKGPSGWESKHGWKADMTASSDSRPVVLLIHGLAADRNTFVDPGKQWNILPYDASRAPSVPDVSATAPLQVKFSPAMSSRDFYNTLSASDMKVATWNQHPCIFAAKGAVPSNSCLNGDSFANAFKTAQWALQKMVASTKGPIALVAHSRGGLVARKLLKLHGDAGGRIKWLVTLHTPHYGTSISTNADKAYDNMEGAFQTIFPASWKGHITKMKGFLLKTTGTTPARNLAAHVLPAQIQSGETYIPSIKYVTFGGTSPALMKVHYRTYTPTSKAPFFKKQLFVTPFGANTLFAETKEGVGDILVTNSSAQLKHIPSVHYSAPLNHGLVLAHQGTIFKVRDILNGTINVTPKTLGDLRFFWDGKRAKLNGLTGSGLHGGHKIGAGWNTFKHVTGGYGGIIYAVKSNGDLMFYKDNARNGSMSWATTRKIVGKWTIFNGMTGGDTAIWVRTTTAGDMRRYDDTKKTGATGSLAYKGVQLRGWNRFKYMTGGENGVLYGVDSSDNWLYCIRRAGSTWQAPVKLAKNWGSAFRQVFGGQNGYLYTVDKSGNLRRYQHTGRSNCGSAWGSNNGAIIARNVGHLKFFGGADGRIYGISQK